MRRLQWIRWVGAGLQMWGKVEEKLRLSPYCCRYLPPSVRAAASLHNWWLSAECEGVSGSPPRSRNPKGHSGLQLLQNPTARLIIPIRRHESSSLFFIFFFMSIWLNGLTQCEPSSAQEFIVSGLSVLRQATAWSCSKEMKNIYFVNHIRYNSDLLYIRGCN